jgi:glucokinase
MPRTRPSPRSSAHALVFAADLGGTKLAAGIVEADGSILARASVPVDRSGPHAPIAQVTALAAILTKEAGRPFCAAAVAVPGLVRPSGTVWAPNLAWGRVPLQRLLERRLAVPTAVESDRNAAVLGEAWRGAGRGRSDVVAVVIGTGIGVGILSGGRLVRGAHELSGCGGWMVVSEQPDPETGRPLPLETLAAGPAIARAARTAAEAGQSKRLLSLAEGGAEALTALQVADAARAGDDVARRIFARAGRLLGYGIGNLVSVFDPEVVVVGGGLAGAADLFLDDLREAALSTCQPIAARQVRVVVSRLGGDANLLGAARLAWSRLRPQGELREVPRETPGVPNPSRGGERSSSPARRRGAAGLDRSAAQGAIRRPRRG